MSLLRTFFIAFATPALLFVSACASSGRQPIDSVASVELALVHGTLYPDPESAPVRDGVVLIADGRIVAMGPGAQVRLPDGTPVFDCAGGAVTAGFWNAHVHFLERKWMDAGEQPAAELQAELMDTLARYGFTSVFDLSSPRANTLRLRARIESGELRGPRIRTTGEGLVPPGAVPSDAVVRTMGFEPTPLPEVRDADEAARAAGTLLADGVDGLKLFLSTPRGEPLDDDALAAAVEEAARAGKPVFVHPNSAANLAAAARVGVDVIAHTTPRSGPWPADLVAALREHDSALIPTLALWKQVLRHDRASLVEASVAAAVEQVRAWRAAGGALLFGTDLGAADPDPRDEYALLQRAGLDARALLAALTTSPASRLGESDEPARLAPGLPADLVVLRRDLSDALVDFADVRLTLRAGVELYRAH